jgi:hypothetical protein
MNRERLQPCPLEIKAAQFYGRLDPVDLEHVQRVTEFVFCRCQNQGLGGQAVIVAFGGICRAALGMPPRPGRSHEAHHDIDLGILLRDDFVGEPVFTEKWIRCGLYDYAHLLGITIEESPKADSGGPNSYTLRFLQGLKIDISPPQRTRIKPRMATANPPVDNPPWLFRQWVEFQRKREWPFAVLADVTRQFTTW